MVARATPKKDTRDKVLPVGFSEAELREVEEEASFCGLTPTQVGRAAILRHIREQKQIRSTTARRAG